MHMLINLHKRLHILALAYMQTRDT